MVREEDGWCLVGYTNLATTRELKKLRPGTSRTMKPATTNQPQTMPAHGRTTGQEERDSISA
jgi:hypothetical protein